jgi:hypothetical protein
VTLRAPGISDAASVEGDVLAGALDCARAPVAMSAVVAQPNARNVLIPMVTLSVWPALEAADRIVPVYRGIDLSDR